MPTDASFPGQEGGNDLGALLVAALDGGDEKRAAFVMALILARLDTGRAADLDRLRRDGPPPVRPF